ncbi:hypothetical protein ACIBEJ_03175 [Nonomuraea sp. NPDC050790]|uniref:hypothetical protein n=1 Tax=Nonomuraea sp. NPDC050790 TaxID=3364371 RepID=UPI00379AA001
MSWRVHTTTAFLAVCALVVVPVPSPASAQVKPVITPVPEVAAPPQDTAGSAVRRGPSPAVAAVPERPVGPSAPEVTTPAGPALVDELSAAADRRRRAVPDLIPDTRQAGRLALSRPLASVTKLFDGLDPLKGVPLLTYRLCVKTGEIACSATQPLVKPVVADVTGDGSPDLAANLVPTAGAEGAVGLGFATRRLGEEPLEATVWAEYDGRVAIGFSGELSRADEGTFSVDLDGKSVKASVKRTEPGDRLATIAGLPGKSAVSLTQTPAATRFTATARLDRPRLEVTSSSPAKLEALAVTGGQTTQVVLDKLRARTTVELVRGAATEARFRSGAAIGRAELRTYAYRDGRLARLAEVAVDRVPPSFTARYGRQRLSVESGAPRARSATITYFDRAADKTVLKAALRGLPARVTLQHDLATQRVTHTSSSALGRFEILLQRDEGAIASPRGGHVTMIKNGAAVGVSALMSGLSGFDVTYGAAPRAHLKTGAGGNSFTGAASIDGTHLARLEISNTPAEVDVSLDPAARTAEYTAKGVIDTLRAAYTNTRSGPTVEGTVRGIKDHVKASWELGERSTVKVGTASSLREITLYANRAHVTETPSRKPGAELRATLTGLRKRVTLTTGPRSLTWDADAPVRSVSATARAEVGGRDLRAAAEVKDVPARFETSWGPEGYRFDAPGGKVGEAALSVTNHDAAQAPTGPHLAAHYDQATGDLDASVRVRGLRKAAFAPAGEGFAAEVRGTAQTLALDADLTLADLRYGALGTVGPFPGRLAVSAGGGKVVYEGTRLDVKGQIWLGRTTALGALRPAPALKHGLSLTTAPAPAASGAGNGAFCVVGKGCFGVRAHVDLTGLPERVTVDTAAKTFTFSGYRPKTRTLRLYLHSTALAQVKASATLRGLPERITRMDLGPFEAGNAAYRIEPAATLGSLDLRAESGDVRGSLSIDPVPAAVAVQGSYGAQTRVRVRNSAAVRRLAAKVTVKGKGSGELRLGDVPKTFAVDADASAAGLKVPAVTYKADAGTLDGFIGVERGLADPSGRLGDVSLAVRDLAAETTVRLNPDHSLDLVSRPKPTGLLEVHAGLTVEAVAPQRIAVSKEVPHAAGFLSYHVGGAFGLGRSTVEDLSLAIKGLTWLKIRPGKVPFGLKAPPALGYVAPGFEGRYARLDLRAKGVDLRPDVRLDVRLSRKIGEDLFKESVRLAPTGDLALRRYDQRMRRIGAKQRISTAGVQLACLTLDAKPGFAAGGANAITLRGADGQQMVSLLDPGGRTPDYAVDLLTHFMSPFPGADWQVAGVKAGKCG